ncbi:disease resistance protein RML1A-like [Neltuma alba]|uniref:disease resistance protein RML1A-like n=1 Tax=Neltuma alba TaxID=207710 RepID=UPI0010A3D3E6|nr:disease resistance protein RML1A-like [Prosopis alba]
MVKQWKRALFETANLAGWDSRIYRDESQLIHNIVNDILKRLEHMYPSTLQGLVGIEENADCIESLLENASIIGIWGMGGIGKTTIAKAVFAKLSFQFESSCFFENLREESEKYGLKHIRDKLLRELLMEEESMVRSTSFAMRRLSCKKVFIVLDDVNKINQLEYLAKECHALGPGSKVIITTRDKHLLLGRVNEIYDAKPLSDYKSVSLFNLKAFHKDDYESGYEELSERVVAYAKGNPLALITLGSFLYSKTIDEWESALTKLEKTSHEDIHAVLKLSYDGLNFEEREMFLEIACFLKGESIAKVVALLDSYGYHATIGLRTLVDKALIRISSYYVEMHDLIQQMGREIVRQECVKNPGRRSRLWNPDEIYDALKNNRVTDAVEGISLDLSQIGDICLTSNTLKKMPNLRFLKFYSSNSDRRSCVNIPSSQGSFSNHLSYLQWDNFPFEALPSSFCAEKLVELSMNGSKLKKLWDGTQDLVNLRGLDLGGSKQLAELPDFSKARKLEWVNLFSCESLSHLHPSILSLHRLKSLGLTNCIKLKHLQSESPLKSLESLSVDNCYGLKEFSLSSESMTVLQLNRTGIESLGSSIGYLQKLTSLSLNCSRLKNIPVNEFYGLRSLKDLTFSDCGEIIDESKLYILFDALQCLISIHLDGSCILTELPDNIKHLSRLEFLSLINCKSLQSLPELPPSIKDLDATNCTSLETLILTSHTEFPLLPQQIMQNLTPYSSIRYLRNLRRLILSCCNIGNRSLSHIMAFAYFCLKRGVQTNQMVDVCCPGREVPDCFKHNQTTKAPNFITIELSSTMNNLQGFIFYSVLPQITPKESCSYRVKCQIYDEDGECGTSLSFVITNVNSHHVFLWTTHKNIFTKYPDANYKPKLSFEFYVVTYDSDDFIGFGFMKETKHDGLIEACGVCPIYAPDYHNFLQQEELEVGTREQRTFEDIEEHSFRGILEYASFSLKQAKYGGFETSTIPEWFAYKSLTTGSSVSVQLNPSFDGLLGFVFCFVIPQFSLKERDLRHSSCGYYDENNIYQEGPRGWHYSMIGLNSNNVFLWYDPLYCELILEDIQSRIGPSKSEKYESKVTFEFKFGDCLIKEGGVRPIYASKYREFLQQKELELKLITGKKRCRSIDDEPQQPTATKKWKTSSILQPVPLSSESKTSHDFDDGQVSSQANIVGIFLDAVCSNRLYAVELD